MTDTWYGDPGAIRASAAQLRRIAQEVSDRAGYLQHAGLQAELSGPYADRLRYTIVESRVVALQMAVELAETALNLQRQAARVEEQIAQATAFPYGT